MNIMHAQVRRVSDDKPMGNRWFAPPNTARSSLPKALRPLEAARQWGAACVHWSHLSHKRSSIRYGSPQQRHPARWARHTRDWSPRGPVTLNPERDSVIAEHVTEELIQPLAA